jgi:hypothetical protein
MKSLSFPIVSGADEDPSTGSGGGTAQSSSSGSGGGTAQSSSSSGGGTSQSSSSGSGTGGGVVCDELAMITTQADADSYADCASLAGIYVHQSQDSLTISLPLLQTVSGYVYFHQAAGLHSVSLPALTSIGEYLYFHQNPVLSTVSLPALATIGRYLYANENAALQSFSAPALTSVGQYVYLTNNTELSSPTSGRSATPDTGTTPISTAIPACASSRGPLSGSRSPWAPCISTTTATAVRRT